MRPVLLLGVALAGSAGAVARYLVDTAVPGRTFPLGILLVNVTGSLLLGILTGLALHEGLAAGWRTVLGTGFCGGFTTFSTTSYAGMRMAQQRRGGPAALQVLGTLALCTLAAGAGLAATGG